MFKVEYLEYFKRKYDIEFRDAFDKAFYKWALSDSLLESTIPHHPEQGQPSPSLTRHFNVHKIASLLCFTPEHKGPRVKPNGGDWLLFLKSRFSWCLKVLLQG